MIAYLRTEQAAEPPRTRSQAEPGNEQLLKKLRLP